MVRTENKVLYINIKPSVLRRPTSGDVKDQPENGLKHTNYLTCKTLWTALLLLIASNFYSLYNGLQLARE